jgi:hypothetical protein
MCGRRKGELWTRDGHRRLHDPGVFTVSLMSQDDEKDAKEKARWAPEKKGPDTHTKVGSNEGIHTFSPHKSSLHSILHGEQESDQTAKDGRQDQSDYRDSPHCGTIFGLLDVREASIGDKERDQHASRDFQPDRSVTSQHLVELPMK